ncbi:hypothetical protein LJR118_002928 [Acidovorax sp. LjRoot118]|uniref:hypothetical protein n=1 Tax=Acidovorax sp. LjRoot118 TaxID=3342256 RepID=UPI003ECE7AE1
MTISFLATTERDLIFVGSDGYQMPIHVAVGAPYANARTEGMEKYAACLFLTCDDPELTTEIFGGDEMEALAAALEFIESFLQKLVRVYGGKLTTPDGTPFDPAGSMLLKESRRLASRNA